MLTPSLIENNPGYLHKLFEPPKSKWEYFWDIVAASYAYNLPIDSVVYMLSVDPRVSDEAKKLINNFDRDYSHYIDAPYENIVQIFFIYYHPNKHIEANNYGVYKSSSSFFILPDGDNTTEPVLNNQGWRLPKQLKLGPQLSGY